MIVTVRTLANGTNPVSYTHLDVYKRQAQAYAQYILFGAPVMCASFVLNNILRSQGRATLSMIGIATGGVLNIALDPLCIFVLDWGIAGAAIATPVSYTHLDVYKRQTFTAANNPPSNW